MLTGKEISITFLIMSIHPAIKELIAEIESFRDASGTSISAFGMRSINDPSLIPDLHAGRMPSLKMIDRIRAFIAANEQKAAQPQPSRRATRLIPTS